MKRWLMLGCALALFAGPAMATVPGVTTGTLINVNDAIQAPLAGQASSVGLSVTADTNVTLVVEGTVDGSTWSTLTGTVVGGTSTATSFSSNGQWTFNTGGLASVRARATVSGATPTATVLLLGAPSIAGLSSNGGTTNTAITGPLARQADAGSVAVGLSNEDVAILQSSIPVGTNTIGNVNVVTNNAATGLIQATASVPITFTAAGGPTQIIAANGSTKIYITHIDYVLSGAGTFALITGTGTNCGTGTTYLDGASGHPLSYAANGGISAGSGIGSIYVTGAGGEICAITTGAVDTSGHIAYAQF